MAWLQVVLETNQEQAESIESCLFDIGALAVTFQDAKDEPLFEPKPGTEPLWHSTQVLALFEETTPIAELKNTLRAQLEISVFNTLTISFLEEKDWIKTTQDNFKPMQFGKHLWVCPSWGDIEDPKGILIRLDPGMAFGTGTHATTALCLEWLEKHPPFGALVIDYGCGSGILGIAALKLGATKVLAVDHDVQALQSTAQNAEQNALDKTDITTFLPEAFQIESKGIKVDLLLANILADPLIELASQFSNLLKKGGKIVLSGILTHQSDAIQKQYQTWFHHFNIQTKDEWCMIEATRL